MTADMPAWVRLRVSCDPLPGDTQDLLGGSVTSDALTGERLDGEDNAGDLSTTEVDTAEAVKVCGRGDLLLLLGIGVLDKLDLFLKLAVAVVAGTSETADGASSLIVLALADKVPWAWKSA
jgi:hypothetical protein